MANFHLSLLFTLSYTLPQLCHFVNFVMCFFFFGPFWAIFDQPILYCTCIVLVLSLSPFHLVPFTQLSPFLSYFCFGTLVLLTLLTNLRPFPEILFWLKFSPSIPPDSIRLLKICTENFENFENFENSQPQGHDYFSIFSLFSCHFFSSFLRSFWVILD